MYNMTHNHCQPQIFILPSGTSYATVQNPVPPSVKLFTSVSHPILLLFGNAYYQEDLFQAAGVRTYHLTFYKKKKPHALFHTSSP